MDARMNAATATVADCARARESQMLLGTAGQDLDAARDAALDAAEEQARFTRWVIGEGGQRLRESSVQFSGMHCAACSSIIEAELLAVPGVHAAEVAAASERGIVRWDPARTRPGLWMAAVRRAGYGAVPDAAAPARALRRAEARQALWRLFVAAFCAMQVMMLATPSYVAGPGDLAPDQRALLNWGSWLLSLPVLLFSSAPFFAGAWRALRARRIGMDVPVALGIGITFLASTAATFDPAGAFGAEVYFDSMTMFVSFLLGSRYLEMRMRHRAAEALEDNLARMPPSALRIDGGGRATAVAVSQLEPGDIVRVPLGQAIPADGVLLHAATACDEALLTGESLPVAKAVGDALVAGSINVGAPLTMRVERVGADTRHAAIVQMMASAAAQRPAMARLADRWAGPFLWAVLALAALSAAAWSFIDPARALTVAVAVLIVTCPCALSLAAPATLVAAAHAFARRGVVLRRLDAIEPLARTQHFFFDKTGTLTADGARLAKVLVLARDPIADIARRVGVAEGDAALVLAAALAAWSAHPLSAEIARAGAGAAPNADALNGLGLSQFSEAPGRGVSAIDATGLRWRLGAADWALEAPASRSGHEAARAWLSRDGQAIAAFEFEEPLREGAAEAVSALRAMGLELTLLTGDQGERALAFARRLGIEDVVPGASPEHKLAVLQAAQACGERVAMVGDGINDAPVLARADVSFAMGQGALVARSRADAVVHSGRLADIVHARRRAIEVLAIVRQNFIWAAAYNAACIPLAMAGWLPPWAAGLGMAASSLAVVLNAWRAAR
jgi:Cu2+-exporting ATPase